MYIARDVSTKIHARGGVCMWRGVCRVCGVFVFVVEGYVRGVRCKVKGREGKERVL